MEVNINILGFSQGAATASRWASFRQRLHQPTLFFGQVHSLQTLSYLENIETFKKFPLHFLIGDADELFSEEIIRHYLEEIKEKEIPYNLSRYRGGHKVLPQPLLKLQKYLSK